MKSACLRFLLLLCAPQAVLAADLWQHYQAALGHDARYSAARAAGDATREKLPQARAGLLPAVSLTASTQDNRQQAQLRSPGSPPLSARYNSNGWSVQLTQPLFRQQNWIAYSQGELIAAGAEIQLLAARQALALRVAEAYFELVLAEENLGSLETQHRAIGEQLALAQRNFELGSSTITDTHEAQARFDLAGAQKLAAESTLLQRRQTLLMLTGLPSGNLPSLPGKLTLTLPEPRDSTQWSDSAAAGNLQVRLAENQLAQAEREAERQRAGHLPTLDLVAARNHAGQGSAIAFGAQRPGSDVDNTTVGLQLVVPLYAGGATQSRSREAVALQEKSRADLEQARRDARLATQQAWLGVSSGIAQMQAYEAALRSSQSALDANRLGYRVGVRINIDVLNAQAQYYDTRLKLARARIDTLLGLLRLKQAAGSLSDDDLNELNLLLGK